MPIDFNSENYSKTATDFYENLKKEEFEKNFSTKNVADVMNDTMLRDSTNSIIRNSAYAAPFIYNEQQSEYVMQTYKDTAENLFSPARVSTAELSEAVEAQNSFFTLQLESIAAEQKEQVERTGQSQMIFDGDARFKEAVKYALANPEQGSDYLNSRLFGNVQFDLGQRFFDLSNMYQTSAYQNVNIAPTMRSFLGKTANVMGEQANKMKLREIDRFILQEVIDSAPADSPLKDIDLNYLFQRQQVQQEITDTNYNPDDNFLAANIDKLNPWGKNDYSEYTTYHSMFGREDGIDKLYLAEDKSWQGTDDVPGVRDLLANAIEQADNPEINQWLSRNPSVLKDLRESKNSVAFSASLDTRMIEYGVGEAMNRSNGFGVAGTLNMLGYGFTTDPSLPLDILATPAIMLGKLAVTGTGLAIRSATILNKIPDAIFTKKVLNASTNMTETYTRAGRLGNTIRAANNRIELSLGASGQFVMDLGHAVGHLQKIMPTQIVSELLAPTARFALGAGRSKGFKNLYHYLDKGAALPTSAGGRLAWRSVAGTSEGVAWGYLEYTYATAVEDVMNEAMFGKDTAEAMAYNREQSGAMIHSMLISGLMGGVLSPTIGGSFDIAGAAGKASFNFLRNIGDSFEGTSPFGKGPEKAPDPSVKEEEIILNNLNNAVEEKVAAVKEKSRLAKAGQATKKVIGGLINKATSNKTTADARMATNEAIKGVEFSEDEGNTASVTAKLESAMISKALKAARGGLSLRKAVKRVMDSLEEGQVINVDSFMEKVTDELTANQRTIEGTLGKPVRLMQAQEMLDDLTHLANQEEIAEMSTDGNAPLTDEQVKENLPSDVGEELTEAARVENEAQEKANEAKAEVERLQEEQKKLEANNEKLKGKPKGRVGERVKANNKKLEANQKAQQTANENLRLAVFDAQDATGAKLKIELKAGIENAPQMTRNASDYRKRLKLKIQADLKELTEVSAAAIMGILGFDRDLVARLKVKASEEETAVLDLLLDMNASRPLTKEELDTLRSVIDDDFLEAIKARDLSIFEQAYHAAISKGESPEQAFEYARYYELLEGVRDLKSRKTFKSPDEMGREEIIEGLRTLENGEERVKEYEKAVQEVKDEEDRILSGDLRDMGFSPETVKSLARTLGASRTEAGSREKAYAYIEKEFAKEGGLTERQKDNYSKTLGNISPDDTHFIRESVQRVRGLIEESVNGQRDELIKREIQRQQDLNQDYQRLENRRNNLLSFGREQADIAAKSYVETMFTEKGGVPSEETIKKIKEKFPASKYATEEQLKEIAKTEEEMASIRKEIKERVNKKADDMMSKKIRLESERIMIESRPPVGFVVPLMRLLMNTSNFLSLQQSRINKIKGSVAEGTFSFDNTITRSDLAGLLASEDLFMFIDIIVKKSGQEDNFNGQMVLDTIKERLVRADPYQAEPFLKSIDNTMNKVFNREIEGTSLFEGEGGVKNQLEMNQEIIEANRRMAEEWSEQPGNQGRRFNGDNQAPIDAFTWNNLFERGLQNAIKNKDGFFDGAEESMTPKELSNRVLALFNKNLPEGNRLKSFDELGGTVDLLNPYRAAAGVVEALTSTREATSRVTGRTAKAGKRGTVESVVSLGARRNTKIQERSDSVIADMFSEYDLNSKIDYLLQNEFGQIEVIRQWLENFKLDTDRIPNKSPDSGIQFLPTRAFDSLTNKLPKGVDESIQANISHFLATDPAFMSTVHDAVFPMYSAIIVNDALHFNDTIPGTQFNPFSGLGWGFPVGMTRGGSFQAGILVASEITFGYKKLFDLSLQIYDDKYQAKYGLTFAEFFFGDDPNSIMNLPEAQRDKIQRELFPSIVEEFDADSSGSNIMLSIVQGVEGAEGLRKFFRGLIESLDQEEGREVGDLYNRFINENYETIYERVEQKVKKDLDEGRIDNILDNKKFAKYKEPLKVIKSLFDIQEQDDINLKAVFKSPTMTDLYQAGAATMGDAIFDKFFSKQEVKDALINRGIIKAEEYDSMAILTSSLLGNLFNEQGAISEVAWVKETLFPNRPNETKITNQKLQSYFNDFKKIQGEEVAAGSAVKRDAESFLHREETLETLTAKTRGSDPASSAMPDRFNNMLRNSLGMAKILSERGFFDSVEEGVTAIAGTVDNWLKEVEGNEALSLAIKEGRTADAETIYREMVAFDNARNYKVEALNSYARQGFKFGGEDNVLFQQLLNAMFGENTYSAENLLQHMSPTGRRAFKETFYNNLATSDHNRIYVPSGKTMVSEKTFRDGEVLSIAKMVADENIQLNELKENIKRLTILDLATKAMEFTDNLPVFEGVDPYKKKTQYDFFKQWEKDSKEATLLREQAIKNISRVRQTVRKIKGYKPANEEEKKQIESMLEENELLEKMLAKIIDSTGERRPEDLTSAIEQITGTQDASQVSFLPSALAFLPKTFMNKFDGAPSGLVRRVQLENSDSVLKLRSLEEAKRNLTGKIQEDPFSREELASVRTLPEDLSRVEPIRVNSIMPANIFDSYVGNLDTTPPIPVIAQLTKLELDNFVDVVNNENLNNFRQNNRYDLILLNYYAYNATRNNLESNKQVQIASDEVQTRIDEKRKIFEESGLEGNALRVALDNDIDLQIAKKELDAIIDSAIIEREQVVRALTQWGYDAKNKVTDLYSLEAETISSIPVKEGVTTIEEAIQHTIFNNDIEAGNLLAWLAGDATFLGQMLSKEGDVEVVSSKGKSADLAMNAKVAFAGGDSAALYLALYAMNYAKRYALEQIVPDNWEINSVDVSLFSSYFYKKLQGDDVSELRQMHPELFDMFEKADLRQVQEDLNVGTNKASENFDNDYILKETTRNKILTDSVTEDIKKMYPGLEKRLRDMDMTIEDLLMKKSEDDSLYKDHKVFINQFGEPISPHHIKGKARVLLLPVEKLNAVNSIGNKKLADAIKFTYALNAGKLPFARSLSSAIGGHDPFASKGSSIIEVRSNAAVLTRAIKEIMNNKGLELQVDDRNKMIIGKTAQNAEFLLYSKDAIENAFNNSDEMFAAGILSDLAGKIDTDVLQTFREKDSQSFIRAMELIPLMSSKDGIFNVYKRKETLRRNLRGETIIDPAELVKDFNDNIKPILDVVKKETADEMEYAFRNSSDIEFNNSIIRDNPQSPAAETAAANKVEAQADAENGSSVTVGETTVTSDPSAAQSMAQAQLEIDIALSQAVDGNVPGDGFNSIYNVLDDKTFNQQGIGHQRFLTAVKLLKENNTISDNDVLLLKAVFFDKQNSGLLNKLFENNEIEVTIGEEGSGGSAEVRMAQRITIAKNLAESFDDISEFGAVGIILEEIGHLVGQRMSKEGMDKFIATAKDLFKDKAGYDKFLEAEQMIYGEGNTRKNYDGRLNEMAKMFESDKTDNYELFGPMFAMAVLLKANVRDFMSGQDAQYINEGYRMTASYVARYNEYKGFMDNNFKGFANVIGEGKFVSEELKKVTDFNSASPVSSRNAKSQPNMGELDEGNLRQMKNEGPNQNKRSYETDLHRIDKTIRDNTENGVFKPLQITDELSRLKAINRFLESRIKQTASGQLVDSPFATGIANLMGSKLDRAAVERLIENIAQPFGARKFALTGNVDNLSGTMLLLLQSIDSKMLISTSAFGMNLPTMQGLGLHLKATFEPLMTSLLKLKAENWTVGMGPNGVKMRPYDTFVDIFWESVMNRNPESPSEFGEIRGWQGREAAKKRAVSLLEKTATRGGQSNFNVKEHDFVLERIVDMVEMWCNDKNGVWKQILTAQVDSGMFDAEFATRLEKEGVMPIKLADPTFKNDGTDGVQSRELMRQAISKLLEEEMLKSQYVDPELFKVIFADNLQGENISGPVTINMNKLQTLYSQNYISKFNNDSVKAFNKFMADINSGILKKRDLFNNEELEMYHKHLTESAERTETQEKMIAKIQSDRDAALSGSQKRTSDSFVNKLSELVAEGYMQRLGSSSYSFIGDKFLTTAKMYENADIRSHLELDPLEVFGSIMRGQAAQAFDRQVFGNAFGMEGIGIKDLLDVIDKNMNDSTVEFKDFMMNSHMQRVGEKRGLTQDEKTKFKHSLNSLKNYYRQATGTLKWDDKDASSIGIINMLNKLGELGSAITIGPRLGIASLLEETPIAVGSSLKSSLLSLNKSMQDSVSLFKSKEDAQDWLQGLGFITQDLMYSTNSILSKIGIDDGRPGTQGNEKWDSMVKGIYSFTSTGLDKQVQVNRAKGVRKFITDINQLFYTMTEDNSLGFGSDGVERFVTPVENKYVASFDQLFETFKSQDLNRIDDVKLNKMLKQLGYTGDMRLVVLDLLQNGLFSEELAPIFRDLWMTYGDDIRQKGIPFNKMLNDVTFDFNGSSETRAKRLQVINAFREITWLAATRFAKQPSLSESPAVGARALGPFAKLGTSLTTYASTVYGTLRRSGTAGASLMASAVIAHAISGYMYYKLIQLQNSKNFDEMLAEMKRDPMQELQEAIMSVPFFGMNQMVIATLLQVLRGQRPQNTQIYNLAGIAMINRMLQLPTRVINSFASINAGDVLKGAANVTATVPLPFNAAPTIGLRSAASFLKKPGIDFWDPYSSITGDNYRKEQVKPQKQQQPVRQQQPMMQPQQQPMRQPRAAQPSGLDRSYIESPSDLIKQLNSIRKAPE